MAIVPTDIVLFLSGGAGNSNVNASLGGLISSTAFVSGSLNNLFDPVSGAESSAGDTNYRCVYVKNTNTGLALSTARVFIQTNTPALDTTVAIGIGTAGDSGLEPAIGSEATAPSGVSFSSPISYAAGLPLGDLQAGHWYPIWIKWTVTAGAAANAADVVILAVQGDSTDPAIRNILLPFNQDSVATMRASPKKVWGHWHSYAISIDDVSPGNIVPGADYYGAQFMNPNGENFGSGPAHLYSGGLMRDRPLPRPHIGTGFTVEDFKTDVSNAIGMGLDGFIYNVFIVNTSNRHWTDLVDLLAAANAVDPGFKIIPNVDCYILPGSSVATIVTTLNTILSNSSIYRLPAPDNRPVITTFAAEQWTLAQLTSLQTGTGCAFIPMFQSAWDTSKIPSGSYGTGEWGTADPSGTASTAPHAAYAHANGLIWVEPARPQFCSPQGTGTQGLYYETAESNIFRQQMTQAIVNGAEWVQICTWNDFGEAAHVAPACGTQYGFYDLAAFFVQMYKNALVPPVVRDCLLYFHRIMGPDSATFNASLQTGGAFAHFGSTATEDVIEAYCFLTSPADIEIELAGVVDTFTATPAGNNAVRSGIAGRQGFPIFRVKRGGSTIISLTSPFRIRNSTTGPQDIYYRSGGSNRPPVALVNNPA